MWHLTRIPRLWKTERMAFHEQWFGPPKRRRLEKVMNDCVATEGAVVEIGCWEGRSTIMLANHFHPETVHCVDHWQGDLGMAGMKDGVGMVKAVGEIEAGRDVFADFTENMAEQTAGNYEVHRMGWREFDFAEVAPIRFIFIDASHTYEEVLDNLTAIVPLMVPGGMVSGDDYSVPQVSKAVNEYFGTKWEDVTIGGPGHAVWGVMV